MRLVLSQAEARTASELTKQRAEISRAQIAEAALLQARLCEAEVALKAKAAEVARGAARLGTSEHDLAAAQSELRRFICGHTWKICMYVYIYMCIAHCSIYMCVGVYALCRRLHTTLAMGWQRYVGTLEV